MKMLKILFFIPVLALFMVACNDGKSDQNVHHDDGMEMHDESHSDHLNNSAESKDKTGPEYTSAYVCPMHCKGSGSDKPGKCPVCGMDYVKND